MFHFFKRPKTAKAGGYPYQHSLAPFADVNGGAEEFAFEQTYANPLFSFRGIARLAGEFKGVASSSAPIISLHPIGAPQGQPFINGEWYIQESLRQQQEGVESPGEFTSNG